MGISRACAEFLTEAADRGVSFARTATIGRQHLMLGPSDFRRLLSKGSPDGAVPSRHDLYREFAETLWWADGIFRHLGATELVAIDASDYEGADVIWDLNDPVPEELESRFTTVFDGGSIEHIFNAPVALASYMRMVRPGGHLILTAPANNYCGHGMYQFSPEFFYRALSEINGFVVERMVAVESDLDAPLRVLGKQIVVERTRRRYEVADPATAGERVTLVNRRPIVLMVQARRMAAQAVDLRAVLQSDYVDRWRAAGASERNRLTQPRSLMGRSIALGLALDVIPRLAFLVDPARRRREARRRSFSNRRYYRRVD